MQFKHFVKLTGVFLATLCLCHMNASADEAVAFLRRDGKLLLDCQDVATALSFEFKVVQPNKLVTFCRVGGNDICIPVQLNEGNHVGEGMDLLIASHVLSRALRFQVTDNSTSVIITEHYGAIRRTDGDLIPAYNAKWGEGRGFRKGQTVPDIPLIDLLGSEVRFSQFLGKRYILYCWASW